MDLALKSCRIVARMYVCVCVCVCVCTRVIDCDHAVFLDCHWVFLIGQRFAPSEFMNFEGQSLLHPGGELCKVNLV